MLPPTARSWRAQIRKHGKAKDTQERFDRFLKWFRRWGRIVYFRDVTDRNIMLMDATLQAKGMNANSIWGNYHRILNSYILDAQAEGLLSRNPYKHLHIDKDKTSRSIDKCLSPEEFRRIEKLQPSTPYLQRVRDLFVFQVYTCLSYTDLAAFDVGKAVDVKGRKVYTAKRGKTKQEFTFLLLKPAVSVGTYFLCKHLHKALCKVLYLCKVLQQIIKNIIVNQIDTHKTLHNDFT